MAAWRLAWFDTAFSEGEATDTADPDGDVHEGIGGIIVGDVEIVARRCAGAQAGELGGAGAHHGAVQHLEQRVDPDRVVEIGRIFADNVRHGRPFPTFVTY